MSFPARWNRIPERFNNLGRKGSIIANTFVLPDNSVNTVAARNAATAISIKVRCSSFESARLISPNRVKASPERFRNKPSTAKREIWFGGIVFGIDWLFYSLFLLLFLKLPLIEILLVPAFDILSVIIGIFIFEKVHEAVSPKVRPSRFYQRQFPLPILYTGAKPWIGERELWGY